MKALILNCTLKRSPDPSNTAMLAGEVVSGLEERGVECEVLRLVDMKVLPGVSSDEGERRQVAGSQGEDPGLRHRRASDPDLARARLQRHPAGA